LARPKPLSEPSLDALLPRRLLVVVIGIDDYERQTRLHCAVADALGVQRILVERFGFEAPIPALTNRAATKPAIEALVDDQLRQLVRPDDALVFFFAGHGTTRTARFDGITIETGYLAPVEARGFDQYSDLVNMEELLRRIGVLPARHILVVLDTCHSGMALGAAVTHYRSMDSYVNKLAGNRSRRVITSARRDEPALDTGPVPGHSLFTGVLIEALLSGEADLDKNGIVTFSELALCVQQRVGQSSGSRQTPDFGAFHLDDRGELLLMINSSARVAPPAVDPSVVASPAVQRGRAAAPLVHSPPDPAATRAVDHAPDLPSTQPPTEPPGSAFHRSMMRMSLLQSIPGLVLGGLVMAYTGYKVYFDNPAKEVARVDAGSVALPAMVARVEERRMAGCAHVVEAPSIVTGEVKNVYQLKSAACLNVLAMMSVPGQTLAVRVTDPKGKDLEGTPAPASDVSFLACAKEPGAYQVSIRPAAGGTPFALAALSCPNPARDDPNANGQSRVSAIVKEQFAAGCREVVLAPKTVAVDQDFTSYFRAGSCIVMITSTGIKESPLAIDLSTPFGENVAVPPPSTEHIFRYCPKVSGPHSGHIRSKFGAPFTLAAVSCPASVK
jgi:hypothetical protein